MNPALPIAEIWVYLAGSSLFALLLTLGAYEAGVTIYERANRNPFANPVAIAVLIVAIGISLIDMPYAKYFEGAQFIHFLLGTATVALAVPITNVGIHCAARYCRSPYRCCAVARSRY